MLSVVHEPALVQTCMGIEGCFSAVFVPTCWPSTRLAKVAAASDRTNMITEVGQGEKRYPETDATAE